MHKLLGCYKDGIITSAVLRDHSLMGGLSCTEEWVDTWGKEMGGE